MQITGCDARDDFGFRGWGVRAYLSAEVGDGIAFFESAPSRARSSAELVDTTVGRDLGFCERFVHGDRLMLCFTTDPEGERGTVVVSSDSLASERYILASGFLFEPNMISGFDTCSPGGSSCPQLEIPFHGHLIRFGLNEIFGIDSMESALVGGTWRLVDYEQN